MSEFNINEVNKRIKKPKYKIGDIIVYPDRYYNELEERLDLIKYYQSKIIEAFCLIDDPYDEKNIGSWCYAIKRSENHNKDYIDEEDILYKLN